MTSVYSDVISSACRLKEWPMTGRISDCGWFYLEGRVRPDKPAVGYRVRQPRMNSASTVATQHSSYPGLQDHCQRNCTEKKSWLPDIVMLFIFLIFNLLKPSGHYMYHQFNIQQPHVLPHTAVFMCFVWISEQTAIISLYNINWLVFVTETEIIKTLLTPTNAQFYALLILSLTQLLHVSTLSLSTGSFKQNFYRYNNK